ncbi:MAG: hydroxymethylbilane synthase [Flavobacteriales bacterium]
MDQTIRIGTRGSDLALWQARFVKAELERHGLQATLHIINTKGDKEQELSFDKIEGKGFFTKEIEAALLSREVDLAVHSHKDLETTSPAGLIIAAVSHRANPSDLLLCRPESHDPAQSFGLKKEAIVGTSSARRKSQMIAFRPDIHLRDIRGNVPTRIQKLRDGQFDAILLASAGVDRLELDLTDLKVQRLDPTQFVPAPAQGVLALQCRNEDLGLQELLRSLHHPDVAAQVRIERAVLAGMNGGCHLPLGVYAEQSDGDYVVHVAVASQWDAPLRRLTFMGEDPDELVLWILREIKPQ